MDILDIPKSPVTVDGNAVQPSEQVGGQLGLQPNWGKSEIICGHH